MEFNEPKIEPGTVVPWSNGNDDGVFIVLAQIDTVLRQYDFGPDCWVRRYRALSLQPEFNVRLMVYSQLVTPQDAAAREAPPAE